MMFAFACRLADIEHAKALVTGESLGQVASQTLENIMAVDEMSTLPVLRPLIGSDKREIMADAERLGTLEISNEKAPDCCTLFMPRSPETHVSLEEAHEVWGLFDHEAMLNEMMEKLEYRSFECPAYRAPKRFHRTTSWCNVANLRKAGTTPPSDRNSNDAKTMSCAKCPRALHKIAGRGARGRGVLRHISPSATKCQHFCGLF